MLLKNRLRIFVLVLVDIAIFYFAVGGAIFIRFGAPFHWKEFSLSLLPFTFVLASWLILFTISHLYELKFAKNNLRFGKTILKLFLASILLSIAIFYFFTPGFTPKTILFLFLLIFWSIFTVVHILFNLLLRKSPLNLVIISQAEEKEELREFLMKNQHLGYRLVALNSLFDDEIKSIIRDKNVNLIVIDKSILDKYQSSMSDIPSGIKVITFLDFYSEILGKIPLSRLTNSWFLKVLSSKKKRDEQLKRITDLIGGCILFLVSLPLWLLFAVLIKLDSPGPVIYKSIRVGKNQKDFYIYKFRTMVQNAAQIGPAWTVANDPRITRVGKFLRWSHFDEVPQVINILKGDLSFVGPRPEEKKLVKIFQEKIPFYNYRFKMQQGVIGWAQINYPHGSSVQDAREKLQYDFYYLEHRNFFFDLLIALKAWRIPFEIKTH